MTYEHAVPCQSPKFQYAVYSLVDGQGVAELESSFGDRWRAENIMTKSYSTWGMPETEFSLVDMRTGEVLMRHHAGKQKYGEVVRLS
jgi:hypothetical protein